MKQEVTNFARFYAVFNSLSYEGNREEFKRHIVRQYTMGRTDSLREMTRAEYDTACVGMERMGGQNRELKSKRSRCLKLMQQMGIDTTDWTRINAFCKDGRIAGKPFSRLNNEELDALSVKLRSIQRKGGLRKQQSHQQEETFVLPMGNVTTVC